MNKEKLATVYCASCNHQLTNTEEVQISIKHDDGDFCSGVCLGKFQSEKK